MSGLNVVLHPFRRHVAFAGIASEGSSESGSEGGAGVDGGGTAAAGAMGCVVGGACSSSFSARVAILEVSALGASSFGVSSTVECFPVVHGGIVRNSSKVRTRGLQHFQPNHSSESAMALSKHPILLRSKIARN